MQFAPRQTPVLRAATVESSNEGRECERCRRLTALLLLPAARPGPWLLALSAACTLVAIRALELATL